MTLLLLALLAVGIVLILAGAYMLVAVYAGWWLPETPAERRSRQR